jgi:hypothetical protein
MLPLANLKIPTLVPLVATRECSDTFLTGVMITSFPHYIYIYICTYVVYIYDTKTSIGTIINIQGGSNMTGIDCGLFTHKSVPVIFESPCIIWEGDHRFRQQRL